MQTNKNANLRFVVIFELFFSFNVMKNVHVDFFIYSIVSRIRKVVY